MSTEHGWYARGISPHWLCKTVPFETAWIRYCNQIGHPLGQIRWDIVLSP